MTQVDKAVILAFLAGASIAAIEKFTGVSQALIEKALREHFRKGITL